MLKENQILQANLGLCCMTSTTHNKTQYKTFRISGFENLSKEQQYNKIYEIYSHNVTKFKEHVAYCQLYNIQSLRVSSDIFPKLLWLQENELFQISEFQLLFDRLKDTNTQGLVLSMHPSQLVCLGSPKESVIKSSQSILNEHFFVAYLLNIREINIHIGSGNYGDKAATKQRFIQNYKNFLENTPWYNTITIENDEFNFNIFDTLEVCNELNIRCTFDVHHHRVHQTWDPIDGNEEYWFHQARDTWKNYDYQRVHISSPKASSNYFLTESITESHLSAHSDYINIDDFPTYFNLPDVHIDVEAKEKELAIFKLRKDFSKI